MGIVLKSENGKKPLVPHLAVCHEAQGFSANNRSVSLLMKADALDDETKEILKRLLGEESSTEVIEKQSVNGKRKLLDEAINQFKTDRWSWAWVEDFDESVVVFSNGDGVYYADYSIENDVVSLGEPQSANRIISYKDDSDVVVLSESDTIPKSVTSLVMKSFESISSNEKLVDVFKSKYKEGRLMEDLQKSVADLQKSLADMQVELEKSKQEKQAAIDALALVEKAQQEAKDAARKEKLSAVVAEDEVEDLHKSLAVLEDEAFEKVLKSLKASKDVVEGSDLFVQKSGDAAETADSRTKFQEMLKSKYQAKA